jgi:transposase
METGVNHNKRRLHKVGYFRELLASNQEVNESIRPLLRLSRDTIVRLQRTEYALVSSLQRDPLLAERIRRLRTVPGVGPITALTWALEMGDVSRFPSIREAISYCGLCGDEKSSADKVMRTRFPNSATNISSVCWWKPRSWRPDKIILWPWSMKERSRKEMPIERRWP